MGKYRVELKKSVQKDFDSISKKDLQRITLAIESLADDPSPPQSKKLSGLEQYRLRQGNYRILYSIKDDLLIVFVVAVGHRKESTDSRTRSLHTACAAGEPQRSAGKRSKGNMGVPAGELNLFID